MAALPLNPQYGPTLGRLLEPRWRAAGTVTRAVVVAVAVGVLALAVAAALTLLDASYSHAGRVPFSFRYRGLYRGRPGPSEYVKLTRTSAGRLEDSYAVAPLSIPAYEGSATGALPLFAATYERTLAARSDGFRLEGEGKTRITQTLAGYQVLYSATIDGRRMYGRDVMLLPSGASARVGVVIEMLSSEQASVSKPVASSGVLERPLKTFSFE